MIRFPLSLLCLLLLAGTVAQAQSGTRLTLAEAQAIASERAYAVRYATAVVQNVKSI